jgi:formylmethanofuran dehydrogenase subunit E
MHDIAGCRYTNMDKEYSIEDLAAFHGHLGPFIVLGYRMGRYAKRHFCSDPFQMSVAVYCSAVPPESCIADGIQIGSGCTLGKRNIEIIADSEIKCEFRSDGRKLTCSSKAINFPPKNDPHYSALIENLAQRMYSMQDSELFSTSSTQ